VSAGFDLPSDYNKFADAWRKSFPQTIYDTKVLA